MTQRVTGESEAKAILKGAIRQIHAVGDEMLCKREMKMSQSVKKSMKVANQFYQDELAWYGDFLVREKMFKNYGCGSTKHWKAEYCAIEPELIHVDNLGGLSRFILAYFDSRKYCKGNIAGMAKLASQFYFHEHFLIRCIQRINERSIGEVGNIIYPVIEWLITENVPLTRISDTNYFVFKDYILVAEKRTKSKGLVFKTILLTGKLTAVDQKKFSAALSALTESNQEDVAAVMVDSSGQVVRTIPTASGGSLLNSLTDNSFWIQNLLTSPDIRVN